MYLSQYGEMAGAPSLGAAGFAGCKPGAGGSVGTLAYGPSGMQRSNSLGSRDGTRPTAIPTGIDVTSAWLADTTFALAPFLQREDFGVLPL